MLYTNGSLNCPAYEKATSRTYSQTKRGRQRMAYYFRMASITGKLKDLDSWIRNRLRYCIWPAAAEKKPERKRKNLICLGVSCSHAYSWSKNKNGRMGSRIPMCHNNGWSLLTLFQTLWNIILCSTGETFTLEGNIMSFDVSAKSICPKQNTCYCNEHIVSIGC